MVSYKGRVEHTVQSSVVGLDVRLLDRTILNDKGITLGAIAAKDRGTVEGKVKALGKGQAGVCKETDLRM